MRTTVGDRRLIRAFSDGLQCHRKRISLGVTNCSGKGSRRGSPNNKRLTEKRKNDKRASGKTDSEAGFNLNGVGYHSRKTKQRGECGFQESALEGDTFSAFTLSNTT